MDIDKDGAELAIRQEKHFRKHGQGEKVEMLERMNTGKQIIKFPKNDTVSIDDLIREHGKNTNAAAIASLSRFTEKEIQRYIDKKTAN